MLRVICTVERTIDLRPILFLPVSFTVFGDLSLEHEGRVVYSPGIIFLRLNIEE
jgi:hypothetical protein